MGQISLNPIWHLNKQLTGHVKEKGLQLLFQMLFVYYPIPVRMISGNIAPRKNWKKTENATL